MAENNNNDTNLESEENQDSPKLVMIIDGEATEISSSIDVINAEKLELTAQAEVLGRQENSNSLLIKLNTGEIITLEGFFSSIPKEITLSISDTDTATYYSASNNITTISSSLFSNEINFRNLESAIEEKQSEKPFIRNQNNGSSNILQNNSDDNSDEDENTDSIEIPVYPISVTKDLNVAANEVSENAAIGDDVGITANADEPNKSDIVSYSLNDNRFNIDSNGVITVADPSTFDRETEPVINLQVTSSSTDGTSSTKTFVINVTDVNDNAPNVTSNSFNANEDIADTTAIGTVAFTDVDTTNGTTSYAITSDPDNLFEINASTGEISLQSGKSLDYENKTSHTIQVTVNDGTNTSAAKTITINVDDVNDNTPAITSNAFSVDEDIADTTAIGTVAFTDVDTINGTTSYAITSDPDNLFEINASTGEISLQSGKSLDYENKTSHTIQVTVNDGVNTSAAKTITINIDDLNDNAPTVTSSSFTVDEDIADTTAIGTVAFTDVDTINGTTSYAITSDPDNLFEINAATGEISLQSGKSLDYENKTSHTIQVTVNDGVNTSAAKTITINIDDLNDNAPTVTSSSFTVDEDIADTTAIGTVAFTDVDTINGTTSYAITSDPDNLFEINAATGEISLQSGKSLDYENKTSHTIQVTVNDGTNTSAAKTITINVDDLNDNAPTVTSNAFSVDEDIPDTTAIGTVAFTDVDTTNGTTTYAITSDPDNLFEINAATGEISLQSGKNLDYENKTSHTIQVTVNDGINTSVAKTITINVDDLNDNAPTVTSNAFSVDEDIPDTTAIGTVAFTDVDTINGTTSYAITSDPDNLFEINAATGEISLQSGKSLDYENKTSHTIQVTVNDGINTSAAKTITINIDDLNDNAPTVTSNAFTVDEDIADTTAIGTVAFTDVDTINGTTSYAITSDPDNLFEINASTGEISLQSGKSLDYENKTSHTIQVTVNDGLNTSAAKTITINVDDVNDNAPTVTSNSFNADEDIADTTPIGTVAFTDVDTTNGTTTYAITNDPDNLFEINAATGEISLQSGKSLDYENKTSHTIQVTVNDGTNTSVAKTITINVDDLNDNAPTVTSNAFSVDEDIADTTAIGTVAFTDVDTTNGTTSYAITSDPDNLFEINAATGEISLQSGKELEYITKTSHTIEVTVDDGVNTSTSKEITINVNDVVYTHTLTASSNLNGGPSLSTDNGTIAPDTSIGGQLTYNIDDDFSDVTAQGLDRLDFSNFNLSNTDAATNIIINANSIDYTGSGGSIATNQHSTNNADLTLNVTDSVHLRTIESTSHLNNGGDVTINATNGSVDIDGDIDLSGGGAGVDAAGSLNISAAGAVDIDGEIYVKSRIPGNVDITAASIDIGTVNQGISAPSDLYHGGDINLTATTGDINIAGEINIAGGTSIGDTGGSLNIDAEGDLDIDGDILAHARQASDINLTGNSINLGGDINNSSNADDTGNISISAESGSVNIDGDINNSGGTGGGDSGGDITIDDGSGNKVTGTITIDGTITANAQTDGDLTAKATGDIIIGNLDVDEVGTTTLESDSIVRVTGTLGGISLSGNTVTDLENVTSDVYYDAAISGNAYLNGGVYDIGATGFQLRPEFYHNTGDALQVVDAGSGNDTLVINGDGTDTYLIESAAVYNTRTGSSISADHFLVSINGTLAIDAVNFENVSLNLDTGDSLTINGDFSSTSLSSQPFILDATEIPTVNIINLSSDHGVLNFNGTNTADELTGGSGADSISSGDGNDTVFGGAGNDTINTGSGDDTIHGDKVVIYEEDFESGATGWTDNTTTDGGATLTNFLGRFMGSGGAEAISKTFTFDENLDSISISFDAYEIDSWDHEAFIVFIDGVQLFSTSWRHDVDDENYSGSNGDISWKITAGERDTMAFTGWNDQIHHVTITIDNPSTSIKLGFGSNINTNLSDESLGIDNLSITSTSSSGG